MCKRNRFNRYFSLELSGFGNLLDAVNKVESNVKTTLCFQVFPVLEFSSFAAIKLFSQFLSTKLDSEFFWAKLYAFLVFP